MKNSMRWVKISIDTSRESEDALSNLFIEMDSGGIQIEDNGSSSDSVVISAYFPPDDMIGGRVSKITRLLEDMREIGMDVGAGKILVARLDEAEWSEPWKEFFKPLPIGRRILVYPSWEDVSEQRSRDILIQINPQMAFGTGRHSTTMLCLELLEDTLKGGEKIADVGTGSGILAIAAIKMGARKVVAIDVDEKAIPIARENARLNGVDDRVYVILGESLSPLDDRYDIIVSNIASKAILSMIPDFGRCLNSNGKLILSGILDQEVSGVQAELESNSLTVLSTRLHEEWAAVLAEASV